MRRQPKRPAGILLAADARLPRQPFASPLEAARVLSTRAGSRSPGGSARQLTAAVPAAGGAAAHGELVCPAEEPAVAGGLRPDGSAAGDAAEKERV